jgi:transglutaminase-like putative cysteine protease
VARRLEADTTLLSAREFVFDSPLVRAHPSLAAYAEPTFRPGRPIVEAILELNHRIETEFAYDPSATDISTPLAQVLRQRRGVCQDFAHVAVGCLRSMGLAARYVSGYLETMPPPGMPRLVGADASHAWASVFLPDFGWLDLDPTNDLLPSGRHIVVGWGRDFSDISPLIGVVLGGGQHRLTIGVDVESGGNSPTPADVATV